MKKLTFKIFLLACPLIIYASANNESSLPTTGLQIVPLENMNLPKGYKEDFLRRIKEEKAKGYQETNSEYARFLLNLKHNAPAELEAFKNNKDPADTHLKNDAKAIPLVFSMKKITWTNQENIIAYAPLGSFVNDQPNYPQGGWTGIKIFFTNSKLGTCSYSFFDLKASHGAVQLNKETTEYLINNKPSSKTIEGSSNSGFLYEINWFDDGMMNELECATANFDRTILDNAIKLAIEIDKS